MVFVLFEAAYCSLCLPVPAVNSRVVPPPMGREPPTMSQAERVPPSPLFNSVLDAGGRGHVCVSTQHALGHTAQEPTTCACHVNTGMNE